MGFQRIPRTFVIAGAAVIATAVVATSGIGQAAAASGPTVYLNRHGGPTDCSVLVAGTLEDGTSYKDSIHRRSCDGTLELPVLKKYSELRVSALAESMDAGRDTKVFTVQETLDYQGNIDNNTAICFLAKAFGAIVYTNMSPKGGDCNGD